MRSLLILLKKRSTLPKLMLIGIESILTFICNTQSSSASWSQPAEYSRKTHIYLFHQAVTSLHHLRDVLCPLHLAFLPYPFDLARKHVVCSPLLLAGRPVLIMEGQPLRKGREEGGWNKGINPTGICIRVALPSWYSRTTEHLLTQAMDC